MDALRVLRIYGIPLLQFVIPTTPLYNHILLEAPRRPLDVFVLAAENTLEDLAVVTSGHLLSLQLPDITDEMAERMGPLYLARLIRLHMDRVDALKRLLLDVPKPHVDTVDCAYVEQKELARAWALATASLIWEVRPDTPVSILRSTLGPLEQQFECTACKASLRAKVRQIILDWSVTTRRTI